MGTRTTGERATQVVVEKISCRQKERKKERKASSKQRRMGDLHSCPPVSCWCCPCVKPNHKPSSIGSLGTIMKWGDNWGDESKNG